MIKRIQLAISAVLIASLTIYGFAARPDSETREQESKIAMERHEARVIKALNLTAEQKAEYDKLDKWMDSESAKLKDMKAGYIERGQQLNKTWRAGLQKVFTKAQWNKYLAMWAPVDLGLSKDPMASGTPFGGTDEAILTYLKISSSQWAQYRDYQKENEVKLAEYYQLMKQDPDKGAYFGHDLNRWTRSTMRKILGEDKYYEWIRLWEQTMYQPVGTVGIGHSPARKATGGSGSIAGKAGG